MYKVERHEVYSSGRQGNWAVEHLVGKGMNLRSAKRAAQQASRNLHYALESASYLWFFSLIDMWTVVTNTNTGEQTVIREYDGGRR